MEVRRNGGTLRSAKKLLDAALKNSDQIPAYQEYAPTTGTPSNVSVMVTRWRNFRLL